MFTSFYYETKGFSLGRPIPKIVEIDDFRIETSDITKTVVTAFSADEDGVVNGVIGWAEFPGYVSPSNFKHSDENSFKLGFTSELDWFFSSVWIKQTDSPEAVGHLIEAMSKWRTEYR